ncbi:deoxynucleoside triphosphate triphosphohydrolase SAMHD1-like [Physella acuta]|uniref:deoxynucleoside triphosphate triphosphohydrolase SAMHD1-like n=1 Tax=Physella acuta TaxID=109671 RepID=UPI0027DD7BDD|nr:deoxynucleoside triphosphate triphosphohydrolase SAMHD1-like [Physella acuta]
MTEFENLNLNSSCLKTEDQVNGVTMDGRKVKNANGMSYPTVYVKANDRRSDVAIQETVDLPSKEIIRKIFNDPIHGHLELHPACVAIIDTPQFQRLRYLKQLGMVYYVYPGAAHNRFEHCLGTSYLAGQFVRILRQNMPYHGIDEKDILCVEIAGLCHDLGHGPLSHLFDQKFIPAYCKGTKWKHEQASVEMFDHLVQEHRLMDENGKLREFGLDNRDLMFIKEQIAGVRYNDTGEWMCTGRGKEKAFLYEIVCNQRNGIDVDKFDYFARDCHHLGLKNNFDHFRFMKMARICEVDSQLQICIRDKEISNLYNMFYSRYTLHKYAYQHRVKSAIETMVLHAMMKANNDVLFYGKNSQPLRMSECIHDMAAYTKLTDDVLFKILYSDVKTKDLEEAKVIIQRIFRRDLYVCVLETKPLSPEFLQTLNEDDLKETILAYVRPGVIVGQDDLAFHTSYLDFGMKDKNPIERLNVYSKSDLNIARALPKDEASRILGPSIFSEGMLRVLCCSPDKCRVEALRAASRMWYEKLYQQSDDFSTGGPSSDGPPRAEPSVAEPSVADPLRTEPSWVDPTRVEPFRAPTFRTEPSTAEPTRVEPFMTEPSWAEPTRVEPFRAMSCNGLPARADPFVVEPARIEPSTTDHSATTAYKNTNGNNNNICHEPMNTEELHSRPVKPHSSQPTHHTNGYSSKTKPNGIKTLSGDDPLISTNGGITKLSKKLRIKKKRFSKF